MTKFYSALAGMLATVFVSCGGGGESDEFTREINDVQTAWKNVTASFTASVDSVKQAKTGWENMMAGMAIPDSVQQRITPAYKARLDSVREICNRHGQSYDALATELETAKTGWDSDTRLFTDWKDKVFKSEIDVETARKDLKDYQAKVKATTGISNKVAGQIMEIRQQCAAHCTVYDSLLQAAPKESETPARRGR